MQTKIIRQQDTVIFQKQVVQYATTVSYCSINFKMSNKVTTQL